MKKLLICLMSSLFTINSFGVITNLVAAPSGTWNASGTYKIRPISHTNQNSAPMVFYAGGTYIANGTVQPTSGMSPDSDPGFTALSAESTPAALTSAHIFVGNASNLPADVAASGAMTLSNTGAFSPVTSSFFTTPSTGSTNNVLTGGQVRSGSIAFGIIAANGESAISVTYGTACTTATYSIALTPLEATVGLPLSVKLKTQSTTGFTAEVDNLSSTTASVAGTLYYTTNCH